MHVFMWGVIWIAVLSLSYFSYINNHRTTMQWNFTAISRYSKRRNISITKTEGCYKDYNSVPVCMVSEIITLYIFIIN